MIFGIAYKRLTALDLGNKGLKFYIAALLSKRNNTVPETPDFSFGRKLV
jgi:hypothetical protein